jgi:hypothetical protein
LRFSTVAPLQHVLPDKANNICLLRQHVTLCYKWRMNDIQMAAEKLIKQHGGLRKAGRAVGIKAPYLSRLYRGLQDNPSSAILRKLGLTRQVSYEPLKGKSK